MRKFLCLALLIAAPCVAQAADVVSQIENEVESPVQAEIVSEAEAEAEANSYLIHAIHLADLTDNAAAVGTFGRPVSSASHGMAYQMLGNTGRIENMLYYMAGAYGVDFRVDTLPEALVIKKADLKVNLDAFLNGPNDAAEAEIAFQSLLGAIRDFKDETIAYANEHTVNESLKSFVIQNLK